jgi:ribonuclease T1
MLQYQRLRKVLTFSWWAIIGRLMNKNWSQKLFYFLTAISLTVIVFTLTGCTGYNNDSIPEISADSLPQEALETLELIKAGGPFPFRQDGSVFHNYEGLLPNKPDGYYREHTVITPGASDRGARRIVSGANGENYYTEDHYASFKLIKEF